MRERWGVLSVRDHLTEAPLVTEVLLYDRLVIPVPPDDAPPEKFWDEFDPELQTRCLEILGKKTDDTDGLALTVPWDHNKRARFTNKMSTAAALATQQRSPDQTYYIDPFKMTRDLIRDEFKPALPKGTSRAWAVAAFSSIQAYETTAVAIGREARKQRLAAQIAHCFLTPTSPDPDQQLLQRAVDLSASDSFRRKRSKLYAWQESVLADDLSDDKAIEELEVRLKQYNAAVAKTFKDAQYKFAYTVIPIGMALAGAIASGAFQSTVLAGAAGLVTMARFAKFERAPKVDAGDLDGAAMIHDAQRLLLNH